MASGHFRTVEICCKCKYVTARILYDFQILSYIIQTQFSKCVRFDLIVIPIYKLIKWLKSGMAGRRMLAWEHGLKLSKSNIGNKSTLLKSDYNGRNLILILFFQILNWFTAKK